MKTLVRLESKHVFEVDSKTLESKTCSYYDPYCYTDPLHNVTYLEYRDWLNKNTELRKLNRYLKR